MNEVEAWFAASPMSVYREKVLEHVFIAEILQECAFRRRLNVEVLHPEVDEGGYDLLLKANGRTRYVQLKSTVVGASNRRVKVNAALKSHREWCIVWFDWSVLEGQLRLKYRWLEVLPDRLQNLEGLESGTWELKPSEFVGSPDPLGISEVVHLMFFQPSPSAPDVVLTYSDKVDGR